MDRFKQMIDELKDANKDLEASLAERGKLTKLGQSTGKVTPIILTILVRSTIK